MEVVAMVVAGVGVDLVAAMEAEAKEAGTRLMKVRATKATASCRAYQSHTNLRCRIQFGKSRAVDVQMRWAPARLARAPESVVRL